MLRSIFGKWTREELLEKTSQYDTRTAFLKSMGFAKRENTGLKNLMRREALTVADLWPNRNLQDVRFPEKGYTLELKTEPHAYFFGLAVAEATLIQTVAVVDE